MTDLLAIYQHYSKMNDEELMQNLIDDPLVNQEWLEKILDGKSACKRRCFWCILWNKNDCIPKK
jgi:hypothetical protein|tara:strand:+ start:776 stop:967 length:192 start_codon:yes stop_codon:yes gene_type:complete